ncbi:MAG: Rid family detoxifying hydrolase [Candidatus Bathyarchaeia archaeon]|jgi:2-iminobutanoate/2-iminopropanoate deaminase
MDKRIIRTQNAPQPIGPYSQATMADGFLFVSGQGAIDPASGQLVGLDIETQTKQTLKNVQSILEASGLSMLDVVKVSIFLKNMGDFKNMNEVYKTFFTQDPPSRTTVEVNLPLPNMLIEIDAIAHRA